MQKHVSGCLGVFLVLVLTGSIVLNVVLSGLLTGRGAGVLRLPDRFDEVLLQAPAGMEPEAAPRVVQMDLTGLITAEAGPGGGESMVSRLKRALAQAVDDRRVKALVLRIDSPGGEVTASDTLYHAVKAAAAVKPVVAFLDGTATGGAYYVACAAGKIVSGGHASTGGIGVAVQTSGGLPDREGLKRRVFRGGAFREAAPGNGALPPEDEAPVQDMIVQACNGFRAVAAAARGISPEELQTGAADGRLVSGAGAVKGKLADRTGYIEDAWQLAREAAALKDSAVVAYTRPLEGRFDIPGRWKTGPPEGGETGSLLLPPLQPGRLYFLPEIMIP